MILRMYLRFLEAKNFKVQNVDIAYDSANGIKNAIIKVMGDYAFGYLKKEQGVHRLVRISPFNADGKRHTSFVSVSVFKEAPLNDVVLLDKDLKIDTFKSSGAGGQHVNTTDSAVRVTHIPTKIVVEVQAERSQHKNKEVALSLLKTKIYNLEILKQQTEKKENYANQSAIDFGSQIRSYVLHPYLLVKDHRTNKEHFNPNAVLDGEIDDFIMANLLI
jgi:peptide chain release factor 2